MSARDSVLVDSIARGDLALLSEGLQLLLRERSAAHRIATAIAATRGERPPDIREFGLVDILRLSRRITEIEPNNVHGPIGNMPLDLTAWPLSGE